MSTFGDGTFGGLDPDAEPGVGPRRIEKFTSADGADEVVFDGMVVEHSTRQGLRGGAFYAAGQHYPVRTLGYAPGLLAAAQEAITLDPFGLPSEVDAAADEILASCHNFGLGKLWTVDDAEVRRWAWACLAAIPDYGLGPFTLFNLPLAVTFDRYSMWMSEEPITGSVALSASPVNFDITNDGFGKAQTVVFRLRSNGAAGFANTPTISNLRGSQSVAIDIDAVGTNDEIRIRTDDHAVEYSDDDGATYSDAYADVTLAATQVGLIEIWRGINPMQYSQASGTPDASLEWSYYETFYR